MSESSRKHPLVSVIVASYNYERFIGTALQSILAQTMTDFEVVVVDDASTDASREVVRSFNDPRIQLHVNEANIGLVRTYNKGVKLAKGTYITYLDSDDWIEPRKLEEQLKYFREHRDVDIVGTFANFVDDGSRGHAPADAIEAVLNRPHDLNDVEAWIGDNKLVACSALLKRSVFERIGLRDETMATGSDYELWTRAHAHGCRFGLVPERLVWCRLHSANASGRDQFHPFLEMTYTLQKNVMPTIEAHASLPLIPKVIGWILAHPQFGMLNEEQGCRLLGMIVRPEKFSGCVDFKRIVLDNGNQALLSAGKRLLATYRHHPSQILLERQDTWQVNELDARKREIEWLENEMKLRDRIIEDREFQITARDREIAMRDDELRARDGQLDACKGSIAALEAEVELLRDDRAALLTRTNEILSSASWRVTRPVRAAGEALSDLRRILRRKRAPVDSSPAAMTLAGGPWTDKWSRIKFAHPIADFSAALRQFAAASSERLEFGTDEEPGSSLWMASLSQAMGASFRERMTILDYGCGAGRYAYFLGQRLRRFRYFGLEKPGSTSRHGERAVHAACTLFADDHRCKFALIGSALEEAALESADVALLGSVFTHVDAEEVRAILEKLRPILARGGKIVFSIFLADQHRLENPGAYGFANSYARTWFTDEQLQAFAAATGATLNESASFIAQGINVHRIFALSAR